VIVIMRARIHAGHCRSDALRSTGNECLFHLQIQGRCDDIVCHFIIIVQDAAGNFVMVAVSAGCAMAGGIVLGL